MGYPITKLVLDQIFSRFIESGDGWNDVYNGLASDYSVEPDMAIDFAPGSGFSANFALANIAPRDRMTTSNFKFPFMSLFSLKSVNTNLEKYQMFAGEVVIGFNVFLSWKGSKIALDMESIANCVEETAFTIFNRARHAHPEDQDWGDGPVYNGDLSLTRSRIERGAEFWDQLLSFQAGFDVHQRGEV